MWNFEEEREKWTKAKSPLLLHFFLIKKEDIDTVINDASHSLE